MRKHYLHQYIASAQHKITINLIGAGGTGSHILTNLAMISKAMTGLGRAPLYVRVFDYDIVEAHNIGRQTFSPADIGENKADVLVRRINRFYGFNWTSIPEKFKKNNNRNNFGANITISCVDSVASRYGIASFFKKNKPNEYQQYNQCIYWMDIGNNENSGQIILGTVRPVEQPNKRNLKTLKTFVQEYPDVEETEGVPSCSMIESLASQDLFINKIMATHAADMLWTLLRDYFITYRGLYINLKENTLSEIPV